MDWKVGWIDWRTPGLEGQIIGIDWIKEMKGWAGLYG